AYYYLGICLNSDRRYGEAIEPLKIALDLQPDYIQAHLALGDAYLKQGDAGEARAEYLRALDLQPGYAPAFDGLGRLLESIGQDSDAETQYRKAIEINIAFADAYTHLGDLYLRKDRLDDAIELFLKAINVKPDFSTAFTRLGVAYARERRYDDAIAATLRSESLAPQDPEPYVALARIYLDLEATRRAEASIQAALALDRNHPGAHLILSDLKRSQEDFEAAHEVLQDLYERGIEDAQMRKAVAEALGRVKTDATRYTALKAAADRAPADPQALVALARFLSAQAAHRRAADLLQRAADLLDATALPGAPTAAEVRFESGLELLAGRLYPRAIEMFEGLLAAPAGTTADDHSSPPVDLRGAALFNLGVARALLGLDDLAIESFTTYLADHPDDARARLYLANACLRLGRKAEARAAYTAYLQAPSPGREAVQVRRILQTLSPAEGGAP
ncbi:MAG TPA: tetratricopeptide repeat protein, partial [Candidatus Polarisedimenticolia bacterium]|nr:tetratricopeptide repeat protein [Candidatus Polarisedimenticolia bacterium]